MITACCKDGKGRTKQKRSECGHVHNVFLIFSQVICARFSNKSAGRIQYIVLFRIHALAYCVQMISIYAYMKYDLKSILDWIILIRKRLRQKSTMLEYCCYCVNHMMIYFTWLILMHLAAARSYVVSSCFVPYRHTFTIYWRINIRLDISLYNASQMSAKLSSIYQKKIMFCVAMSDCNMGYWKTGRSGKITVN